MTKIILVFSLISLNTFANDQGKRPKLPPGVTETQATCLKNILGEPGKGERPSREKMEAAFASCGVEKPMGPPPTHESGNDLDSQNKEEAGN